MKDVNRIEISRDDYDTQEDFENAIKKAIMVLLDNRYIMVVRYDDGGVVVIEFNPANESYGYDFPVWLSPEEFESVMIDGKRTTDLYPM